MVPAAVLLLGGLANAAVTRIAGPGTLFSDSRRFVKFDAAYDSLNRVHLVVYGTQGAGPVNGMFVNEAGQPVSGVLFAVSGGAQQSGWARVIFSPEQGKFLVSYVKIVGTEHHQKIARFVTYAGGGAASLGPEMILDDWLGGSGTATGIAYASASGRFLVSWSHYNGAFPSSFVSVITPAGAFSAPVVVSNTGDGQSDPEIACDPNSRKCLVIGTAWGVLNGGKNYFWARFIDDSTAGGIGPTSFNIATWGGAMDPPAVAYNAAANRFLVAVGMGGTIKGMLGDGASGTVGAPVDILRDLTGTNGVGYGFLSLRYNAGTQTTVASMTTWVGFAAIQEFDANGNAVAGGFALSPDTPDNPGLPWDTANQFSIASANTIANQFLLVENHYFLRFRTSNYAGGPAGPPPPPPPPPCAVTPGATGNTLFHVGGSASVALTASNGSCPWTAQSNASWLTITSGASGVGNGTVTYAAARNATGTGRTGTMTIAGQTFTVIQSGIAAAAVHDLNGDGISDLIGRDLLTGAIGSWSVSGLALTAMAPFQVAGGAPITSLPLAWRLAGSGDVNGDGYADLVWQNTSTGDLVLWLMQNNIIVGTPALSIPNVGTIGWQVRAVGDVNGDGRADLIWQNSVTGGLAVWTLNGPTVLNTFLFTNTSGAVLTMPDANWQIVGAGDLNRDGRADVIWQNQITGGLGAWTMSGNVVTTMRNLAPDNIALDYKIRGVGDVNGDGMADLIWVRQSDGVLFVWCMSGFNASVYQGILMVPGGAAAALPPGWTLVGPG